MNTSAIELPLRDIHLPDAISWWPPAPGWWLTGGAFLLVFFLIVFWTKKCSKPNLRKQATYALNAIEKAFLTTDDATQCLSDLSVFLRRVVLSQNHATQPAGVTGVTWLKVLDQPLNEPEFSQGCGQILLHGPYQPQVTKEEVLQVIQLCRKWVKRL